MALRTVQRNNVRILESRGQQVSNGSAGELPWDQQSSGVPWIWRPIPTSWSSTWECGEDWAGLKTLFGFGPRIAAAAKSNPDGLLLHEDLVFSLIPPHLGMRQYWRDFESLERWARSEPHRKWWQEFVRDSGGTGFWHEAYFMRGGMEAVYVDLNVPTGFSKFAPVLPARGPMFSARGRVRKQGEPEVAAPVQEEALYADAPQDHR